VVLKYLAVARFQTGLGVLVDTAHTRLECAAHLGRQDTHSFNLQSATRATDAWGGEMDNYRVTLAPFGRKQQCKVYTFSWRHILYVSFARDV
jgi:hypothetical protein